MGCCCFQPEVDSNEVPNQTQIKLDDQSERVPVPSLEVANKYKEEGKKYFNSGNYKQAVAVYKLALAHDTDNPVQYTNLALAEKALHKFQESISTITKMQQRFSPNPTNLPILTKAKLIKSRCQSTLVKNFCLNHLKSPTLSIPKSEHLLEQSISTLTNLLDSPLYGETARKMNTELYLERARNIRKIFLVMKDRQQDFEDLVGYFRGRLGSRDAGEYFGVVGLGRYMRQPKDMLAQLQHLHQPPIPTNPHPQQPQFTIDPITYQQYTTPILIKSGLTYQKQVLINHYSTNGLKDPITKEELNQEFGVNNLTLVEYIGEGRRRRDFRRVLEGIQI